MNLSDTQPYNDMTPVRRQTSILNDRWDVDKGIILDILGETWNKIILWITIVRKAPCTTLWLVALMTAA